MNYFLPPDYQPPETANDSYMKLEDGENLIRILSSPVLGWEDWDENKHPVRFKFDKKPDKSICEARPIRHSWSFIVWNYNKKKIQILHICQATIRNAICYLCNNEKWGNPCNYDIFIDRKGIGQRTKYQVSPRPKEPLSEYIMEEFYRKPCNLEALFTGGDPFAVHWKNYTPAAFEKIPSNKQDINSKIEHINKDPVNLAESLSKEQIKEIEGLIDLDLYPQEAVEILQSHYKCDLNKIAKNNFPKIVVWLKARQEKQKPPEEELPF